MIERNYNILEEYENRKQHEKKGIIVKELSNYYNITINILYKIIYNKQLKNAYYNSLKTNNNE